MNEHVLVVYVLGALLGAVVVAAVIIGMSLLEGMLNRKSRRAAAGP